MPLDITHLWAAAFSLPGVGAYAFDGEGTVLACNDHAGLLLGWEPADLVGRRAHETFHYADTEGSPTLGSSCPILLVAVTGRPAQATADCFWRRDGTGLTVWWTALPVPPDPEFAGARAVLVFGVGADTANSPVAAATQERGDEHRVLALGQLSELLSSATQEEGVARVAGLAASSLADWCVVDLLDGDRVRRVALADRTTGRPVLDAELGELPRLTAQGTHSLSRVLRGEENVAVELDADAVAALLAAGEGGTPDPLDLSQARLFATLGAAHAFVVPLRVRDEVLGAMTWVRQRPDHGFTDSDVLLATVFGLRVGLWLDNVRLHDQQKRIAETLQRSLLTALPQPDHLELVARYAPAARGAEVGGDWYDAWITGDDRTMIVVGDVTGHDIDAAARMAQLRNMLRVTGLDHPDAPSLALAGVDRAMALLGVAGQASVVLLTIDQTPAEGARSGRHVTWSNAGHPPPLLLPAGGGPPELLETTPNLLLGVRAATTRTDTVIEVEPGATLLLYTDGLVERPQESLSQGLDRLVQLTSRLRDLPLGDLADALLEQMRPPGERLDDIAVIAVRFHDERRERPDEAGPNFLPAEHDPSVDEVPDNAEPG